MHTHSNMRTVRPRSYVRNTRIETGSPGRLFMLIGSKGLTQWVDLRYHQYPKMDCWQVWGGAFMPKKTFEVSKKTGVTKLAFIDVKRDKG